MSRLKTISLIAIFFACLLLSCVDPYDPKIAIQETNFLIVHGHINSTNNSVTVNLTKTINLSDTSRFNPESGATITVEDLNEHKVTLNELSAGLYYAAAEFDNNSQYRLMIEANDSKKYYSEFIELEPAQISDSISWRVDNDHLEILVNAKDLTIGSKYYRFTYEETFEYRSYYQSHYQFVNGVVEPTPPDESVYQCWATTPSGSIILESTENLTQNIIADLPLLHIANGNKRLNYKYSLLVKQIVLNQTAYNYWYQLRKTTESLGGLFDPIPSSLNGNIKSEMGSNVLGFFSGGDVSEERISINSLDLPESYRARPEENCEEFQQPIGRINELDGTPFFLTTEYGGFRLEGYYYTTPECADCRLKGGTNKKPVFMN
jgi:hypothetical protein